MKRLVIAQVIATLSTLTTIAGWIIPLMFIPDYELRQKLFYVAVGLALVAYIFGGFITAIKMSFRIGRMGWFFAPFPLSILAVILTFILAGYAFLFFPIIPVRKAYKEAMGR